MREIGFAVQPRTYLTQRGGSLWAQATAPARGAAELLQRARASQAGGSQQGFVGALSSAYAGHTLLHSKANVGGATTRLSTGFSPDGIVNSARIGLGPGAHLTGAIGGGLIGGAIARSWSGVTTGALVGADFAGRFGARDAPGAFHDETGIHHDPRALGLTRQVGPGLHGRFTAMQTDLMNHHHGTYSFSPDLRRTQNCGTSAISQMRGFVDQSRNHLGMMGELQSVFQRAGGGGAAALAAIAGNRGNRMYTANQRSERTSLGALHGITRGLERTVQRASARGRGNQGYITNFAQRRNAAPGAL